MCVCVLQDALLYDDMLLQEGDDALGLLHAHGPGHGHNHSFSLSNSSSQMEGIAQIESALISAASSACASRGISAASSPGTSPLSSSAALAATRAALLTNSSRHGSLDSFDPAAAAGGSVGAADKPKGRVSRG